MEKSAMHYACIVPKYILQNQNFLNIKEILRQMFYVILHFFLVFRAMCTGIKGNEVNACLH